jgi:DNA modification methylase
VPFRLPHHRVDCKGLRRQDHVLKVQFPIELIEKLVLAPTNEEEIVLDLFVEVGSHIIATILHNRKSNGLCLFMV